MAGFNKSSCEENEFIVDLILHLLDNLLYVGVCACAC